MPPTSPTKTSTRRLSEVARHVVIPKGEIATSAWPKVEARILEFGDRFDEWQVGAARLMLGKRANGEYAATVGGITLSIPRQVAKTYMISRILFALCTIYPDYTALWTAHRTRTTTKTFNSIRGFAMRANVSKYVASIRAANGEQEIRFTNGSMIMFGAREQGFGRGFDEVDAEVFDEAQILTEKALEDMVAATNQSRHPHGALLFFMGTPPRPTDPGEAFRARRIEALSGESEDAVYIECSADPDADPDDREQWAKANPSFPHRTPLRSMLRLRKNLPSDDSWLREALGIWDDDRGTRPINVVQWRALGVNVKPEGESVFGVAFSADGMNMSLGAATVTDPVHVELLQVEASGDGLGKVADFFCELDDDGNPRWKRSRVVISGQAGAHVLRQLLRERRVPDRRIVLVNTPQYLAACALFEDAVKAGDVTHLRSGQEALDECVAAVEKDKRGGWTVPDGDETPIESVSLALWGARTGRKLRDPSMKRKAVIT